MSTDPVLGTPLPRLDLVNPITENASLSVKDRDYGVPNIGTDNTYLKGQMQSAGEQAGRAILGGIATGAIGSAEYLSYFADIFSGVDGAVENEVASYLREKKQEINEEYPIYKSKEGISISDSATYFEGLKAILDSGVSFGIGGGVIGKTAGLAGKALHATRLARLAKISEPVMNTITGSGAAVARNYMEGTSMAVSLYEDIERDLIEKYPNKDINEIKNIAAEKASAFRWTNALFLMSDAKQMSDISKMFGFTRGFEKRNHAKEMFLKQSLPEFLQEGSQSVGENVFRESAVEDKNIDVSMIMKNVARAETLFEATIGAVAGPLQYGVGTLIANRGEQGKAREQRYQESLQVYETMGELLKESVENTRNFEEGLKSGKVSNDDLNTFAQSHVNILAMKAFKTGTADEFERQLDAMIEEEQETDKKKYLKSFKEQFTSLEKEYVDATVYANASDVFLNRGRKKTKEIQQKALQEKLDALNKDLTKSFVSYGLTGYEAKYNPTSGRFEIFVKGTDQKIDLNSKKKTAPKKQSAPVNNKQSEEAEAKAEEKVLIEEEDNSFSNERFSASAESEAEEKAKLEDFYKQNSNLFERLAYINKHLGSVVGEIEALDTQYKYITSDKGQDEYKKRTAEERELSETESRRNEQVETQKKEAEEAVNALSDLPPAGDNSEDNSVSSAEDDLARAKAMGVNIETEENAVSSPLPVLPTEGLEVQNPKIATGQEPINPDGEGIDTGNEPSGEQESDGLNVQNSKINSAPPVSTVIRDAGYITKIESENHADSVLFSIANFTVPYVLETIGNEIAVLSDKQSDVTNDYRLDSANLTEDREITLFHDTKTDTVLVSVKNDKGQDVVIGSLHNRDFISKYYQVSPEVSFYLNEQIKKLEKITDFVKQVGKVNTTIKDLKSNNKRDGISVSDKNGKYFVTSKGGFFKVVTKTGNDTWLLDGKSVKTSEIKKLIFGNNKDVDLNYLLNLGVGQAAYITEDGKTHNYTAATIKEISDNGDKRLENFLVYVLKNVILNPKRRANLKQLEPILRVLIGTSPKIELNPVTRKPVSPEGTLSVRYSDNNVQFVHRGKVITLSLPGDVDTYINQLLSVTRPNQSLNNDEQILSLLKQAGITEEKSIFPQQPTVDTITEIRNSGLTANTLIVNYTDINGVEKRSCVVNPIIPVDFNSLYEEAVAYEEKLAEIKRQVTTVSVTPVAETNPQVAPSKKSGKWATNVARPDDISASADSINNEEEVLEEQQLESRLSDISIEGVSEGTLMAMVKSVAKNIIDSDKEVKRTKKRNKEEVVYQASVNEELEDFFAHFEELYQELVDSSELESDKTYYASVLKQVKAAKENKAVVRMRLKGYLNLIKTGNELTSDFDYETTEDIEKDYDEDFLFRFDPKSSASNRLKAALMFIREHKKDGQLATGLFGDVYLDPNMIWFKLRDVLSVLDSSSTIEDYLNVLKKNVSKHPEFADIISLLEEENQAFLNEFIGLTNIHENVMTNVNYSVREVQIEGSDKVTYEYYISVNKTNDFDRSRSILKAWKTGLQNAGIYVVDDEGNKTFNAEKYEAFKEKLKQYDTKNKKASELTVKEMFKMLKEDLGIEFPKSFVDHASTLDVPDSKAIYFVRTRVFNAAGLLRVINKRLIEKLAKNPTELASNDGIDMAIYMSKFDSSTRTRTQRVGDKIFSGYILPNSITNKSKKLKRSAKEEMGISKGDMLKDIQGYLNDPFSKDSVWLEMLYGDLMGKENDGLFADELTALFNVNFLSENPLKRKGLKVKKATELGKISPVDLAFVKLGLFFSEYDDKNETVDTGVSTFVSPTIADVKSLYTVTTKAINFTRDLNNPGVNSLNAGQYKMLIRSLFLPEVKRAMAYENAAEKPDIAGFDKNAFRFFFVNAFNQLKYNGEPVFDETTGHVHEAVKAIISNKEEHFLNADVTNIKDPNLKQFVTDLKTSIYNFLEQETKKKTEFILENALDKDRKLVNIANNPNQIFNFVANYAVSNSEWFKLFLGDPALYGNKNGVSLNSTLNDIGKRIKGQHSPGIISPYRLNRDNRYNTLIMEDIMIDDATSTDSEEYITINEHIENLYDRGLVTEEQYNKYIELRKQYISDLDLLLSELTGLKEENFKSREEYFKAVSASITPEIIEQIKELSNYFDISSVGIKEINPLKPVQHGEIYDEQNNPDMSRVTKGLFFCKSSTKVLISSFTAPNKTLDDLRVALDILEASKVKKFTLDRVAAKSGVKLGKPVAVRRNNDEKPGYTSIQQGVSSLLKEITGQKPYKASVVTLNRNVLKYQQDFVDKENKKITPTSQGRSMFALDMMLNMGMKTEYEATWNELYKKRYEKLKARYTTNGKVDYAKVKALLIEHAEKLNYSKAEIDFLKAGGDKDFLLPLISNPNYKRLQYLFTSLFTKGVTGEGISGDSQVLLSSAGLDKSNVPYFTSLDFSNIKNSIVYAEGWDGELKDERKGKDGKTLGAQVIVPLAFHYRDENGKRVKMKLSDITITDPETGKKTIDTNKIPKAALQSFGFRIPYQGHGSSAKLEIVGFLPERVNGIIAPATFVAKMGGDYDFDKLNIYTYNLKKNSDSDSYSFSDEETDALENKIITSHIRIRSDWERLKAVEKAIKYGNIYNEANPESTESVFGLISALKQIEEADKSIASEMYQDKKYHNAKGAKSAIGIYANFSVLLGYMQDKNIDFANDFKFSIGKDSRNSLKDIAVVGKPGKTKSEVIMAYLSLSIDNEKLQAAGIININDITINATAAAAFLGFDEDILYLLNQPSVVKMVERITNGVNTVEEEKVTDFREVYFDTINELYKKIIEIDPSRGKSETRYHLGQYREVYALNGEIENKYSLEDYKKNLQDTGLVTDNTAKLEKLMMQVKAVKLFGELNDLGKTFQTISSALNTDSKGTPKTVLELYEKSKTIDAIRKKKNEEDEDPFYPLVDYEQMFFNGIKASANTYGIFYALNDITQILGTEKLFNALEDVQDYIGKSYKATGSEQFDMNSALYKDFVSYLYARTVPNASAERERLLVDTTTNVSLPSIFSKLHSNPAYRKLLKDFPVLNYIKATEHSEFNVSFLENTENDQFTDDFTSKYASFNALYDANIEIKGLTNGVYTTRDLYKDLVSYCMVCTGVQGANDFFKYVNPKYLVESGIAEKLNEAIEKIDTKTFAREFISHNPEILAIVRLNKGRADKTKLEKAGNPAFVKDRSKNIYFVDYEDFDVKTKGYKLYSIPSYEVFGINEYNNPQQESLFSRKSSKTTVVKPLLEQQPAGDKPRTPVPSLSTESNKNSIISYLNEVALHPESTREEITAANFALNNKELIPDNVRIEIDSNLSVKGQVDYARDVIKLKKQDNTKVNLEEIVHLITNKAVRSNDVSDSTKQAREKLVAKHKEIVDRLRHNDPSIDNKIKLIQSKVRAQIAQDKSINNKLTEEEMLLYRLTDMQEFVAGVMLDRQFNEYVFGKESKLTQEEKKSLFETLTEFLRSLLADLGLDYTNPNHLEALNVIINLVEESKKQNSIKEETKAPPKDSSQLDMFSGTNLSPDLQLKKEVVVNDIKFTDIVELGNYLETICK